MSAQPARACKVAEPPAGDHKTSVEPLAAGTFDPRLEATAQASVHEYAEAFMLGFTLQDSMRASYMPRMGPSPVLTERGSPLGQNTEHAGLINIRSLYCDCQPGKSGRNS
jgi:hypothetical protein